MNELVYQKLTNDYLLIKDFIKDGLHTSDNLDSINRNITYINTQISQLHRNKPTEDQTIEYYEAIELGWMYYTLREYYHENML